MMRKPICTILFIAALIVFLILVIPLLLFTPTHVESKISTNEETLVDTKTPIQKPQVCGLFIEFQEGVTEPQVKAILESCNMTRNWIIKYNVDYMGNIYYAKVDEGKREELNKEKNWNDPVYPEIPEPRLSEIKKGNYHYIIVPEEDLGNEGLLKVMKKYNLQVKKSVVCYILFGDGSGNYSDPKNWITWTDAARIKNDIETNEKVLIVSPDDLE
ncbi:MAG: UPF0228 family protein [Methanosarcina sp.]|uniref:UPF0228 family protein n=1 Tax=Methanosarcina sp. TaxID=2213 RepID=UPI003BB4BE16